jgi:hypothetical protein
MQTTNSIFLIRPSNFTFNLQTASTNTFQNNLEILGNEYHKKVMQEFDTFISKLKSNGLNVFVFEDTDYPQKPDAIFPNNWLSLHSNGTVILYPMFAENRRHERRMDIIESLKKKFRISTILDLSHHENTGEFLEGTGSIVFDHTHKKAYACLSPRTHKNLFLIVCENLNYKPIYFSAFDEHGKEIYHTNVMMCIGEKFVVVCLDSIVNKNERHLIVEHLKENNLEIIDITYQQMNNFAGNMLSIKSNTKRNILVMSQSAFECLTTAQKETLTKYNELLPVCIQTIESIGGGSARCMMAEIFLTEK